MKLSTRMTIAMVVLVSLTAAAVGLVSYRNVVQEVLPRAQERVALHVGLLASDLQSYVRGPREDITGFLSAAAVQGIERAELAGGFDPDTGWPDEKWRQQMAGRFVAELSAKPAYKQFRIIGADGLELVRVDRAGEGETIRVVPDGQLRNKSDRPFFQAALKTPPGKVYVSPVELYRGAGPARVGSIPVLRIAANIPKPDRSTFGILLIDVDMRPILAHLAASAQPGGTIYAVDDQGAYLVNPDPARTLKFARATPWWNDFPQLAAGFKSVSTATTLVADIAGSETVIGIAPVVLAGGPRVAVFETTPEATVMAPIAAVGRSTLLVGLISIFGAAVLAFLSSRSLTRPLAQMTAALREFPQAESGRLPGVAAGELGQLKSAFSHMQAAVKEKAETLEMEIGERRRVANLLSNTITSMQDPVVVADHDGAIVLANPAAQRLMGVKAGMTLDEYLSSHQVLQPAGGAPSAGMERPMMRALRGEVVDNSIVVLRRPGAAADVTLLANGGPIDGPDPDARGALIVYRDVTKETETERQLRQAQKMEAVGQLTGGVAHDFNNILTVITGTIETLQEGVADRPELSEIAQLIDEAAQRGADLTRHLLAFSRRQPLQPENTNLNQLIVEAGRLLRPTLGEHVEIESMLTEDVRHAVVDPNQLITVLLNLAINARDAMPRGGKLTIETANIVLDEAYANRHPDVAAGPYAMIAVSDTGSGIPKDIIDKVFEPFFTTKETGKGTGLGLSMVYGFVKQSGGHIKIYSEIGHGTTVRIYLPPADEGAEAAAHTVAPRPVTGNQETVLIVEDDALVRNYVIAQVKSLGYRTLSAANAAEALAVLERNPRAELLFTDIVMPGAMNGRQLADEAKRRYPHLQVLYTSGYTENAIVHHGRLDPGVLLLSKPYRKSDLARMIHAALSAQPSATRAAGAA